MTQLEKRIKIAEACRWRNINPDGTIDRGSYKFSAIVGINPKTNCVEQIPDVFNDLNAIHEAWLTLLPFMRERFESELYGIVIGEAEYNRNDDAPYITNATATQRAEAFGRTLELW